MEDRYALNEYILDKNIIQKFIHKTNYSKTILNKGSSITLLIMGHGRERYKENFEKMLEKNVNYYSEPFAYKVKQQKRENTVRILSKAGKPKICAWDYQLCSPSMSSQDIILELSHLFFSLENENIDTFSLMNSLSLYFKTLYPKIIEKIAKNYRDLPEDKNPGSPDAFDYTERYENFQQVLGSLEQNKFSDLKALRHEKIFTIRPEKEEEYSLPCERYLFEIVEFRTEETNEVTHFILHHLKVRENLVKNYYSMKKEQLNKYINQYISTIYEIQSFSISEYEKFYLNKFIFSIYFGNEISLSEIVEFFVLLGVEIINIIDNTCRISENTRIDSITPKTSEIEREEHIVVKRSKSSKRRTSSRSSGSLSRKNSK